MDVYILRSDEVILGVASSQRGAMERAQAFERSVYGRQGATLDYSGFAGDDWYASANGRKSSYIIERYGVDDGD